MLENLNLPIDHPGVPFARVEDTLALVSSLDRPQLRLNLDLYHVQIGEGNLIELVPQMPAVDRRDPGGRRAGPHGAGYRRDQLSQHRASAEEDGLSRPGLHGGNGVG